MKPSPCLRYTLRVFVLLLAMTATCPPTAMAQEKTKKINIKKADKGYYSKGSGRNRLLGNVVFEHDGALMYCDSAWLYSAENRLEAFENVRINQGDTLFLTGDYLEYTGNTSKAIVTGEEVVLRDPEMTLTTDRLDYNRRTEVAYYTTEGTIVSENNTLTSVLGHYYSGEKMFYFKDSVRLHNPDYTIFTDTMDYSSDSEIAFFKGPTRIVSDSSYIYCENGRYNTQTDIAQFEKNARIYDNNKILTGDSIYYEKQNRYGEAFCHVTVRDTVDNYLITGDYGEYWGENDSTFVTQEPLYTVIDEEGDSLHVHGDTIYSVLQHDSLGREYRLLKVYFDVKFYKSSMQGVCDSLTYTTLDSTFRMYDRPVIWDDSTQISGDTIYMLMKNEAPDSLKVFQGAFMISIIDSTKHNQVSGKRMVGKFVNNEMRRVHVYGNGRTAYYPKEEDGDLMGLNRSICANIVIHLYDSEVKRIVFLKKPEGTLYPMDKIPAGESQLPDFLPRFNERPRNKTDLFFDDYH